MVVEGAGEDRHEGGQERETALSSFGRFVPHLSVEGPHYVGDLGVQEGERAMCGVCVVCGVCAKKNIWHKTQTVIKQQKRETVKN